MAYPDLSLPELRMYTSSVHAPADLDAFWSGTLDEARRHEHPDNVDQVIRTLGYFDGTVFAQRARMPALFSVGLMDPICPPSTAYAAYNAWAGPKEIREYVYNEHEGGGPRHQLVKLDWLASLVGYRSIRRRRRG